ncbi:alanine--glyoxylate aminotransferase 2, mitochondrial isoform X1 [Drosophila persimilis]|uniref:alanine--glyoxylate aminotransferase 2, mitochondrial isoform X1 n=1 Tax=Drosophila persimilis TaxID=7234 RepID=UPI000F07F3B0|nr:alanine--glyoxylate aminotransferase 2, mitochondrial isoform X1 [Drosophila persimilis]
MMSKRLFAHTRRLLPGSTSSRSSSSTTLYSKAAPAVMNLVQNEMPETQHRSSGYVGPSYEQILKTRKTHLTPNVVAHFKKPLVIHEGHMQWLYDHEGRRYLDMFGGIVTVSVGHCHPKVNQALSEQISKLWHTTNIYMHPKIHEYAERLVAKFPSNLKSVCFVNSGSEANDLAMLMARIHTGNQDILSFRNAYHGMSPYTMGLTAHSTWRFSLAGVNNGLVHVMNPDPYQGIWGGAACRDSPVQTTRSCQCQEGCQAGDAYYNELEETFKYSLPRGKVAAMFAESIQGVGGTVQFPKGYLKRAAALIRANGGLFVADEVQTGFGRTGEHFWGFEGHDYVPDIVTMAKGIGNGFPLAAVVTTPEIAASLGQALHFNTYGGNPMASAVGIAVLDVIEEEQLQRNSLEVGTYFLKCLEELQQRFEIVGDVRGKGLMIGVELVEDREKRTPLATPHVLEIWETCKDLGVLFGRGGLHGNVLSFRPPLCVGFEDVELALNTLETAFQQHMSKRLRGWRYGQAQSRS